jgi:hypothetical protein
VIERSEVQTSDLMVCGRAAVRSDLAAFRRNLMPPVSVHFPAPLNTGIYSGSSTNSATIILLNKEDVAISSYFSCLVLSAH